MTNLVKELLAASEKLGDALAKSETSATAFSERLSVVSHNQRVLTEETSRMCELCSNAKTVLKKIDDEFSRLTGLTESDYAFLAIATALQTARWIVIDCLTNFGQGTDRDGRLDHDDRTIKDGEKDSIDTVIDDLKKPDDPRCRADVIRCRTWHQILTEPVPYDVTDGSAQFGLGMNGKNHREMTLGHDPLLGWIFGTINIITDTTTIKNLRTFRMSRNPKLHFSSETTLLAAFDSARMSCRQDRKRLAAAIAMEAIHLKSDFFSKAGLPIPVITTVLPDLSSALYKENYDALCFAKDVGTVVTQAQTAILINLVIAQLHGYFYDPAKCPARDLYEVRTRKILLYSNILAETSNVLTVAVRHFMGDVKAWKHLDFGGLAVMIWRIITDVNFMYKVREEFVYKRFSEEVLGDYERKLWPVKEV